MKCLVTGGTGFLGSNVVQRLIAAGHEVHAVVRPSSSAERVARLSGSTVHTLEEGAASLYGVLDTVRPDVVHHLAARFVGAHQPQDIRGLVEDNVTFGAILADAMAAAGVDALVQAGTAWQFCGDRSDEPMNLYAATKEAAEAVWDYNRIANGLRVVSLVIYDTYGEGDPRPKLMPLLAERHRTKSTGGSIDTLPMSPGDQRMFLVHSSDVARAFELAGAHATSLERGGSARFAVRGPDSVSLKELVQTFESVSGTDLQIDWGGRPYREREVMNPWTGGETVPGWSPDVTLESGIERLVAKDGAS